MAFIMEHSCETLRPELNLFKELPTDSSLEHGYFVEHSPVNNLTDGPITFEVR